MSYWLCDVEKVIYLIMSFFNVKMKLTEKAAHRLVMVKWYQRGFCKLLFQFVFAPGTPECNHFHFMINEVSFRVYS